MNQIYPRLLIILLLGLTSVTSFGQDIIITRDSLVIRSTVAKMDDAGIYYQALETQQDSLVFLSAENVRTIRFREERSINDIPDFMVICILDDLYHSLQTEVSDQKKCGIKANIYAYYAKLDSSKEEQVRNALLERIIKANKAQETDHLLWLIEEYLYITPFDRPGRGPLYEILSQFYETSMNLDGLERIKYELNKYEQVTGYRCFRSKTKVIMAIAHVKKAFKMGEEMIGFWVSSIYNEKHHDPKYFLYIDKNDADSLEVHLYSTEDLGTFHQKKENMIVSQRILLNGIKQEYGFTFATDKIDNGNQFMAHSVVSLGSALAATAAERATMKSENPNYHPTPTGSIILNLAQLAAMELAKSKKKIEIIDIFGNRLNSDIISARLLYAKNIVTAGEIYADNLLEKDIEFKFYRIYPDDKIFFIDKNGNLKGPETEFWTKAMHAEWWKTLFSGQKERMDKNNTIQETNKTSYQIINEKYENRTNL